MTPPKNDEHNWQPSYFGDTACCRCGCQLFNLFQDGYTEESRQPCPGRKKSSEKV
jgi:hypothetical protein